MSTTRVLPRLGVAVGTLFAILWAASPALAADAITASISGLASTLTAGDRNADGFATTMRNRTKAEIQPVRRVIVVRLTGVSQENVRVVRGGQPLTVTAAAAGEVQFSDTLQIRLGPDGKNGDTAREDHGIQFLAGAPNGRGELLFQ